MNRFGVGALVASLTVFLPLLTGCQTAPLALNYTPSSLVQGKGEVKVGGFRYLPAERKEVAPDQIRNTAIGRIHIGQPISEYVSKAFASELKYAGYTLDGKQNIISADIEEFTADDLGFSVDWRLKMNVKHRDRSGKSVTKPVVVEKKLEKFGEFSQAVNLVIKEAFEQTFADANFKKTISR